MKKVKQFRYYGMKDGRNTGGARKNAFVSGNIFNGFYPIKQLGIQTLPGTKFSLNKSLEHITIGPTGIYELELENNIDIFNLAFHAESMNSISNNDNGYLIVDIIYEAEE